MRKELARFATERASLDELRAVNARLSAQLLRAKVSRSELVEAVYRAAGDAVAGLDLAPVKAPPAAKASKTAETAIAVLSDWQLAKITPTYSSEVCEKRIEQLADKVLGMTAIQRSDHPVTDCRVYLLGDLCEGELIFPGQSHLIDASLYRQVTLDGPRILGNFLRRMLTTFQRVHVIGVIGNHGALGGKARRDYSPESNADRMLYRVTQQLLAGEKRLTWCIPDGPRERNWYAIDRVGEKRVLLFHGDQVKGGFAGFPFYGFAKKVWGWHAGAVSEPFDYAMAGHFHQPTRMTLNTVTLWVNGSTESTNTYAAEQLAAVGRPSQWLFFAHPRKGITAEYCVYLD